jgi:hypothetical protein
MPESAVLIIPDIHHKVERVERIRAKHPHVPAIFLGDYFDDFFDTTADMEKTCQWLQCAIGNEADTFLLGNHCFAYITFEMGVRWGLCSGWDPAKQQVFHEYFPGNSLLNAGAWTAQRQGWLISHAGITKKLFQSFSKRNVVQEIVDWVDTADLALRAGVMHPAFLAGAERGGGAKFGGILWADWNAFEVIRGIPQIVGHTPADEVRYKGTSVCLDTHLRHYGMLENGELTVLTLD